MMPLKNGGILGNVVTEQKSSTSLTFPMSRPKVSSPSVQVRYRFKPVVRALLMTVSSSGKQAVP
jgi:hypothetical protein